MAVYRISVTTKIVQDGDKHNARGHRYAVDHYVLANSEQEAIIEGCHKINDALDRWSEDYRLKGYSRIRCDKKLSQDELSLLITTILVADDNRCDFGSILIVQRVTSSLTNLSGLSRLDTSLFLKRG